MLSSPKPISSSDPFSQSVQAWDFGDLSNSEDRPRGQKADFANSEEFTPMWQSQSESVDTMVWTSFLEDFETVDSDETTLQGGAWIGGWHLVELEEDFEQDEQVDKSDDESVDHSELLKELYEERQRLEAEKAEVARLRREAEEIILGAKGEEQTILTQARLQAAARVDEANVQNQMLQQSFQEELAKLQEQVSVHLNTARSIAEEARAWRDNLYAQGETTMLQLVIRIGQTLFGDGFALDPTTLGRAFARALTEAHMLGNLRIYVNPADAAQLSPYWLEQQAAVSGQKIELAPSESIKRGGCYIDGQFGAVDALIESQFQAVRDALMTHIPSEQRERA